MAEENTQAESSGFTVPNPNLNPLLVNPANQINAVKLNDENFLIWQLQILSGIRGLGLEYLLHEDTSIPPRVLDAGESTPLLNPLFVTWSRQEQLLFSFFSASMAEGVQSQMIGCATAAQVWIFMFAEPYSSVGAKNWKKHEKKCQVALLRREQCELSRHTELSCAHAVEPLSRHLRRCCRASPRHPRNPRQASRTSCREPSAAHKCRQSTAETPAHTLPSSCQDDVRTPCAEVLEPRGIPVKHLRIASAHLCEFPAERQCPDLPRQALQRCPQKFSPRTSS